MPRDTSSADTGGDSKRQKTSAAPAIKAAVPESLSQWITAHLEGRISSLTNPVLKEFCKSNGLAVGGKKDDLLARIHDHLEAAMAADAVKEDSKEAA